MALDALHAFVDRLASMPGLRQLRERRWDSHFINNKGLNLFRGVYRSYQEALDAIPASQRDGYDSDAAASLYTEWLDVFDYDYPAMFWIQRALLDGMRHVLDLGGNLGIKYYAFRKHCVFPADLRWTVVDVPAVVRRGRDFALQRGDAEHLTFAEHLPTDPAYQVLFASGSLQYLPRSLPEMLSDAAGKPKWIVVNITPLHPRHTYFTVNSFGPGFCAYRVQERNAFLRDVEASGYTVRNEWKNVGKVLDLPFDPGYGLDHYSGVCFERTGPS